MASSASGRTLLIVPGRHEWDRLTADLEFIEEISRNDLNHDPVSIEDDEVLSSFNKTKDGEIAVPGLSSLSYSVSVPEKPSDEAGGWGEHSRRERKRKREKKKPTSS